MLIENRMEMQKYQFSQLEDDKELLGSNTNQIAELIYKTDPYIYPAIFGAGLNGLNNAQQLIPMLFSDAKDSMFTLNNIFVASIQETIVGIILWINKPLDWDESILLELAKNNGIDLKADGVMKASKECFYDAYFTDYKSNFIYLVNVCVDEKYRGQGIGKTMIEAFISQHPSANMGLSVLKDNTHAINVYKGTGFVQVSEMEGFSLGKTKPSCLKMERIVI